jgi:hypothetical protein
MLVISSEVRPPNNEVRMSALHDVHEWTRLLRVGVAVSLRFGINSRYEDYFDGHGCTGCLALREAEPFGNSLDILTLAQSQCLAG